MRGLGPPYGLLKQLDDPSSIKRSQNNIPGNSINNRRNTSKG